MKRDEDASHPRRPWAKEGRLWLPTKHALDATKTSSKEQLMNHIGIEWRKQVKEQKETASKSQKPKTKPGDKRAKAQRKKRGFQSHKRPKKGRKE